MWAPGMGELLIIMVVVLLIFGTSRLKNIGKDLGGAISEFKTTMKPGEKKDEETTSAASDVQEEKQEAPEAAAKVTRPMPGE